MKREYHVRACRIAKHGCSSIRDHFGSSVFTVRCFSKILEGFAVVLSHIAFPLTDGHLSCPELGHSCFSFSLLGFHDCFRKKSLWGFFFFFSFLPLVLCHWGRILYFKSVQKLEWLIRDKDSKLSWMRPFFLETEFLSVGQYMLPWFLGAVTVW